MASRLSWSDKSGCPSRVGHERTGYLSGSHPHFFMSDRPASSDPATPRDDRAMVQELNAVYKRMKEERGSADLNFN